MTVTPPSGPEQTPDPAARPKRRSFTAEYKLAILTAYEAAPEGAKGAVLRREGLYSSHLLEWRAARDAGALGALTDRRASPLRPKRSPEATRADKLRRDNERLAAELERTRTALDIMGKAHALLQMLAESAESPTPTSSSMRHLRN